MPPTAPTPDHPRRRIPSWARRPRPDGPRGPVDGTYEAVTRIEVIEPGTGRAFMAHYAGPGLDWSLQDPDPITGTPRTLKLFPHSPRRGPFGLRPPEPAP